MIVTLLFIWAIVAILTGAARNFEVENEDVGGVAAGVLWPIYLPYRLALIIWSRKP